MDYNKLFELCQKNSDEVKFKKQRELNNRKVNLKNRLFNDILHNIEKYIVKRAKEGYESAIIYDDDYNELLVEYLNELRDILKPFNLTYIKKTYDMKSLFEIIVDDTNYVLIIDWKKKTDVELKTFVDKSIQTCNKYDKWHNFYKKICILDSKNILEDNKKKIEKWQDFYKKICILEAKKYITNCDNSVEGEWGFVNMIYNA
jgi:hypothetical protein